MENLIQVGLKAVMKRKRPFVSKKHKKAKMGFAVTHLHCIVEDQKRVIWSDKTKINYLRSNGRKLVYKSVGESLSDRLVEGTQKFS
jgi:hypothetical protein